MMAMTATVCFMLFPLRSGGEKTPSLSVSMVSMDGTAAFYSADVPGECVFRNSCGERPVHLRNSREKCC